MNNSWTASRQRWAAAKEINQRIFSPLWRELLVMSAHAYERFLERESYGGRCGDGGRELVPVCMHDICQRLSTSLYFCVKLVTSTPSKTVKSPLRAKIPFLISTLFFMKSDNGYSLFVKRRNCSSHPSQQDGVMHDQWYLLGEGMKCGSPSRWSLPEPVQTRLHSSHKQINGLWL